MDADVVILGRAWAEDDRPSLRDVFDASYRRLVKVINDVSLTIARGETVAVVGESGSGKSTLARVICGLLPPEAGSIQFTGEPLPISRSS